MEEQKNKLPMPRLETERLLLRPFCLYDAKIYKELYTDPAVLDATDMPHGQHEGAEEEWIISHPDRWNKRYELFLLITDKRTRTVIGSISLFIYERHNKADVGYWIAKDAWGRGYATEAAEAVVKFAFKELKFHKLEANHLARNPASGNVLTKVGFQYEGVQREGYLKGETHEDLQLYGLLRREYEAKHQS